MKCLNRFILISIFIFLSACSQLPIQTQSVLSDNSLIQLPNWYHDSVGLQLLGENQYPKNRALATLLNNADQAFMQENLTASLAYLERAQRIATREPGLYVRLSYLFWVQQKNEQAIQMARRALALMQSTDTAREEVQRLLVAIKQNM